MSDFFKNPKQVLASILILAALTHFFRLDYPNAYVFDEVYHAFTAKEYLKGSKAAWEWWTTPPPGVAYEWTHPPLAKEIMAASMFVFRSTDSWAWRFPGALLGVIGVYLVYLLSKLIFNDEIISLTSAFIFSLDGLNFVQSRTGMNDIYFVTFMVLTLILYLKSRFTLSAISLGCAISSKWTGIYLGLMIAILLIKDHQYQKSIYYLCIVPIIYFLSYAPFFILGHDFSQFIELQRQMWYYHTHLKAHHDYASPWWTWPLNLYPVWYYVQYLPDKVVNIFASGNPVGFIIGISAILMSCLDFVLERVGKLFMPLLGFFIFWLPWAISPRIMFLYHYSPSIPFLSITLGYQLNKLYIERKYRNYYIFSLILIAVGFVAIYPWITGIPLPKNMFQLFFHFSLTKNPFR